MRPTSSVPRNWPRPSFGIADEVVVGHPHVVEEQLAGVEPLPADAAHLRPHREPGRVLLDDEAGELRAPPPVAPASVRASSVTPNDMSVPALEMNALRPLINQPPSWRSARVVMPRMSEPASGSVSPNAPSTRPSASGRSQRSRWSSLPNRNSGIEPMVTWAWNAAATDWSAWPSCSSAATKPTVDIPMPPHSSGTSMPSRPSCPSRAGGRSDIPPAPRPPARGPRFSFVANCRHRSTRSRSASVSEKSMRNINDESQRPLQVRGSRFFINSFAAK